LSDLIFQSLDELVDEDSKYDTGYRSNKVDPEIFGKGTIDNARSQRTNWIHGAASPEDACIRRSAPRIS
jgi:hypothetical protein